MITQEDKRRLRKAWYMENADFGRELGYPECCIQEFCNDHPIILKHRKPSKNDKRRHKAARVDGFFTGFVPCAQHSKQIVTGKITLASLIRNRKADFPTFPDFEDYSE